MNSQFPTSSTSQYNSHPREFVTNRYLDTYQHPQRFPLQPSHEGSFHQVPSNVPHYTNEQTGINDVFPFNSRSHFVQNTQIPYITHGSAIHPSPSNSQYQLDSPTSYQNNSFGLQSTAQPPDQIANPTKLNHTQLNSNNFTPTQVQFPSRSSSVVKTPDPNVTRISRAPPHSTLNQSLTVFFSKFNWPDLSSLIEKFMSLSDNRWQTISRKMNLPKYVTNNDLYYHICPVLSFLASHAKVQVSKDIFAYLLKILQEPPLTHLSKLELSIVEASSIPIDFSQCITPSLMNTWSDMCSTALLVKYFLQTFSFPVSELQLPPYDFHGASIPAPWWNTQCDKDIILGIWLEGVGSYEDIRDNSLLVFHQAMVEYSVVVEVRVPVFTTGEKLKQSREHNFTEAINSDNMQDMSSIPVDEISTTDEEEWIVQSLWPSHQSLDLRVSFLIENIRTHLLKSPTSLSDDNFTSVYSGTDSSAS